jgi:hypothetical protein
MGNTPSSDKRMPDGPAPEGRNTKVMDKESPNSCEAFDGKSAVVPLKEMNYLKDANGQS